MDLNKGLCAGLIHLQARDPQIGGNPNFRQDKSIVASHLRATIIRACGDIEMSACKMMSETVGLNSFISRLA